MASLTLSTITSKKSLTIYFFSSHNGKRLIIFTSHNYHTFNILRSSIFNFITKIFTKLSDIDKTIDDTIDSISDLNIQIYQQNICDQSHGALGTFNNNIQNVTDNITIFSHNDKRSIIFTLFIQYPWIIYF